MREYVVIKPKADVALDDARATDYLARTVYEDYELVDTGVLDQSGNKIMAHMRFDPVGYVRFK